VVGYNSINDKVLNGWLLVRQDRQMGAVIYIMAPAYCVDCRYFGTNEKPDFWH
jgi:hypothetical protein